MVLRDWIFLAVAVLGVLFGLRCYIELWRWARQCQHARIAIYYKRKVKLQAPLVEWLLWTNQLNRDKDSAGRVVFQQSGVGVMISKAVIPPGAIRRTIRGVRARKTGTPRQKQGHWSSRDESKPSVEAVRKELTSRNG